MIGLIKFPNGSYSYIKLPHGCKIGQIFEILCTPAKYYFYFNPGSLVLLKYLRRKVVFCNLVIKKYKNSTYASAAGTFCRFIRNIKDTNLTIFRLPTGFQKRISNSIFVILGRNSNIFKKREVIGKAGSNMKLGRKSIVRGVAMNAVDHPHGGRTKTNQPEVSP